MAILKLKNIGHFRMYFDRFLNLTIKKNVIKTKDIRTKIYILGLIH